MKKDFNKKNRADLIKELEENKLSLRSIRFGLSGSKAKNTMGNRDIKRDIARINTALKTTQKVAAK